LKDIELMRQEMKDRFGEYPEEVEHLFQQIELKVMAAAIGFTKVEFQGELLALHFPPPEENEFFEGDAAPFQKIMGRLHELKAFHPSLKQEKNRLKLTARMNIRENSQERLRTVRTFLEKLAVL
jgi:transcription-repair coupling factor (superfamily II helicase)